MTIDDYAIVTMTYEVRDGGPSGTLLERMDVNYPFKFMFGTGRMLPAWERRIFGLKSGMGFSFQLGPDDAYGQRDDRHISWRPPSLSSRTSANRSSPACSNAGSTSPLPTPMGRPSTQRSSTGTTRP